MRTFLWTRALGRYAERLHARAGLGHHAVSPLGAWMVVALCAPAATRERDREALARVLGADPDAAFQFASALLADPHPLVSAGAGLWLRAGLETPRFRTWRQALPVSVDTGDLPSQSELDVWAADHTQGLIEHFPLELSPTTVCVLASALATRVSWEVPFDVVDAAELGPSRWSGRVRSVLRAPRGDPRHRQFLTETERAGTVCVHLAAACGGLLVGSVIAASEGVPPGDVLAAAEEIVTSEARERASVHRLSLFDLPLGTGPLWSLREEPAQNVKTHDGRTEQVVSVLPGWSATTDVELLGDEGLGFDEAAVIVAGTIDMDHFVYQARQVCTARYSAVGFEAAAVTGLAVMVSAGRPGVRRIAEVRFAHPYAVVAAVSDDDRRRGSGAAPSGWHGLPVFSAWVSDPTDAESA
jgi:hypothetical protein